MPDPSWLIVPQFHYDVAYLQTEEQYYVRCFDNFRAALDLCDAEPDYRYTIEQPFLVEQFAARCPTEFARMRAAAERGRIEISGALWVIPDMNLPSGESLLRQIRRGRLTAEALLGRDVDVAWIADTWGHVATLPQVLAHGGVRAYLFTRGMRPDLLVGDFLWVGLDGTELPAHWLPGGYATLRFPDAVELDTALEVQRLEATETHLLALVERLRPHLAQDTVLLCNGGDFAPPQASAPAVVRAWQQRGLPVRFGFVREYADALTAATTALPRVEGEFNPLFIGTQASRIRLKLWNRQLEGRLAAVERAAALLDAAVDLDGPERILLKNQFHDTISGTLVDAAFDDAAGDYATAFAQLDQVQAGLGGAELFNPSGFERTEWLEGVGVTLAPLGCASRPPAAAAQAEQDVVGPVELDNGVWQVTMGAGGTLTSVLDRAGNEYAGGPGWGDLVYRNDNGDLWLLDRCPLDGGSAESALTEPRPDDPYRRTAEALVNDNPVCQHRSRPRLSRQVQGEESRLIVRGVLGFWRNRVEYETVVSLRAGDPLITFETRIRPSGRHYRLYACCGTPWAEVEAWHEVAFGTVRRDARRYVAQTFCEARTGDGHGLRLLNAGTAGSAVSGGIASLLLFRSAAMEYKAESGGAFEEGVEHVFRYAVRPFSPDDPGHGVREGERLNLPLLACRGGAAGFALTPDNVHLSALRRLADGAWLVRVYETAGHAALGELRLEGLTRAWRADGRERRGEVVPVAEGRLALALRPHEIAAWIVER